MGAAAFFWSRHLDPPREEMSPTTTLGVECAAMWLSTTRKSLFIVSIVTVLAPPPSVLAQEKAQKVETAMLAGFFDVADSSPPIEAGFELRRTTSVENLDVVAGITGTEEGSGWVYGGARYDLIANPSWLLAPGFAVALYEQGDGKDLGQTLEFRSSIEVARQVSDRLRVGFVFYHLSNASMADHNPGANSLALCFAFRRPRG